MRRRCVPNESSEHFRPFNFLPPDPDHSSETIARCREALKAYDSFLNIWWSTIRGFGRRPEGEPLGAWRIVEWMPKQSAWSTVSYWETADGLYRAPDPNEMLAEVQRMDAWKRGEDLKVISDKIEAKQILSTERAKANRHEATIKDAISYADFMGGHKKHYDMGARP